MHEPPLSWYASRYGVPITTTHRTPRWDGRPRLREVFRQHGRETLGREQFVFVMSGQVTLTLNDTD